IWAEMGRIARDPAESLRFFQEARHRGSQQPNLLVWIARSATAAGNVIAAEQVGRELLDLVEEAESVHGDRLFWPEKGHTLWKRAHATCGDDSSASALVSAIADHSYRKHWGHTTLGMVALHRGDLSLARQHLRESAAITGDYRLSAYG